MATFAGKWILLVDWPQSRQRAVVARGKLLRTDSVQRPARWASKWRNC
jgi:hypothetical protein